MKLSNPREKAFRTRSVGMNIQKRERLGRRGHHSSNNVRHIFLNQAFGTGPNYGKMEILSALNSGSRRGFEAMAFSKPGELQTQEAATLGAEPDGHFPHWDYPVLRSDFPEGEVLV